MTVLHNSTIHKLIDWKPLINELRIAFTEACEVPNRNHYSVKGGSGLLVMPAWGYRGYLGIKVVTTTPSNPGIGLPFVQGFYVLFDQATGSPLLQLDAGVLTNYRTAAASALASNYLSNESTSSMLMIGAGSLAPYLIAAHKSIRPIQKVYIWSRDHSNAETLAERTSAEAIVDIDPYVSKVDLISCATPSKSPLVRGEHLVAGQHLDLVGGYLPDMREVDDVAIRRSDVFIDTPTALAEAGDLIQPMRYGILRQNQVLGDLRSMAAGEGGRASNESITLFKSTGHAIEDIATAVWLWEGAGSLKK